MTKLDTLRFPFANSSDAFSMTRLSKLGHWIYPTYISCFKYVRGLVRIKGRFQTVSTMHLPEVHLSA